MLNRRMLWVIPICLLGISCAGPNRLSLLPVASTPCHGELTIHGSDEAIRWLAPTDPRHRARLASWCAGVGTVVFQSPATVATGVAALDEIAFVSWNVHVGGGDISALVGDLRAGRLTHGRPVHHFVLLLQEAVRVGDVPLPVPSGASAARWIGSDRSAANDISHLSDKVGASILYVPSMRNGRQSRGHLASDRGNAIVSTLPLSDPVAVELPGERQRRVAIVATIQIMSGEQRVPLAVSVAHFDATRAARTLWFFGAPGIRETQARSLTAALPDEALVLGADLNTWLGPNEPAARDLRQFFLTHAPSVIRTSKNGFLLDYMFFRPPPGWRAHYERASSRYGSDHYPLIGWFLG